MCDTYIINGKVYREHRFQTGTVGMCGGKIKLYDNKSAQVFPKGAGVIDAAGMKIVPGFIDIHTHGAAGADVNGAKDGGFERMGRFFASHGVTSFVASIVTDTKERTEECISRCSEYKKAQQQGANLLGLHLEGPFLSPDYRGAMIKSLLRAGDIALVRHYQKLAGGIIKYMTVAPEVDGVLDIIPEIRQEGIVVSMGHTGASYDVSMKAVELGVKAATHAGNAMKMMHQREPAAWGAAMDSDVYCEAICDGKHLHPATVRILLKTKGAERIIAITDSLMATGLPDGRYYVSTNEIVVKDGDAMLAKDGTRAGSTLTMESALKNMLSFTGRTIEEVLPAFTENPARLMGVYGKKGSIEDGKDADIVMLDGNNNVSSVFIGGHQWFMS